VRCIEVHLGDGAGAEAHRAAADVEHRVAREERRPGPDRRAVPELHGAADVHGDGPFRDDDRVAARLEAAHLVRAAGQMQAFARLHDDVAVGARRQRHVAADDEAAQTRREHRQRRQRIDERQRAGR
jgi:hypothetical protein